MKSHHLVDSHQFVPCFNSWLLHETVQGVSKKNRNLKKIAYYNNLNAQLLHRTHAWGINTIERNFVELLFSFVLLEAILNSQALQNLCLTMIF